MCDCFHVVLPTWPGAPGSVSGCQLQPEEPDVETEEDAPVTEGPAGEVIRPRPQGSSPVYECPTEGVGFRVQEDTLSRQGPSRRRRSWWKRDSGNVQTFSNTSGPESVHEAMEVLKTEVEAGASGYSVTGGGDQGIFVKQVLKDSSAAKLFSLREGDQLLSATIFFDDIKYEDALKILQYSEPYKVQFQIKRKLCATEDEEWALHSPQHRSKDKEKQDKEVADRCAETPMKTLEAEGDQERLLTKPGEALDRRPRERLSWPKFQGTKGKKGPGPRRSHSSSEACEPGGAREVSPTSTDTEAQFPAERGEQKAVLDGQRRRRRFLNLSFKMGSRLDPAATGHWNRQVLGGPDTVRVLEERSEDTGAAAGGTSQETAQELEARQGLTTQQVAEPSLAGQEEGATARRPKKMKQVKARDEVKTHREAGTLLTTRMSQHGEREAQQSPENRMAAMSLEDTAIIEGTQRRPQEIRVRIRELKTPRFTFSSETLLETEEEMEPGLENTRRAKRFGAQAGPEGEREVDTDGVGNTEPAAGQTRQGEDTEHKDKGLGRKRDSEDEETDKESWERQMKLPRFKIPAFGWSPKKEAKTGRRKQTEETQKDTLTSREAKLDARGPEVAVVGAQGDTKGPEVQPRGPKGDFSGPESELSLPSMEVDVQAPGAKLEGEVTAKDSKFKMPKFKMPSFGVSSHGKSIEASLEVSAPKVEADVSLPAIPGDLKSPEVSIQLPSTDVDLQAGQVGVKLPEGALPEGELHTSGPGDSLKVHLPTVEMPTFRVPKVDLKGPQVDTDLPKVELKGPKGELRGPEAEVSPPSAEVDVQAPCAKLESEVATKDSKFKMPKFKMPSFGVSSHGKSIEASLEVSAPKVEADVSLPAIQGDLKSPEVSIQLPSTDVDLQAGQVGEKLSEGALPEAELHTTAVGGSPKVHLPKVQLPSIKVPKVDLKGPKGELSGPKPEVSLPSMEVDIQVPGAKLEGEVTAKDSKFKMPKFRMPSFGLSGPTKSIEASMDVSTPKVESDVSLPAIQGDLKSPEVSIQLPSTDMNLQAGQVGVKLPEGALPKGQLQPSGPGDTLKVQLPTVEMPSIKVPKVELKGPKGDLRGPEAEVSLPSVEVDVQAPDAKLESEVATKDSKFKMPKFKMPSFGVSGPGKSTEASVDVSAPEVEGGVSLSAIQGDLKSPEVSIQLPSTDVDLQAGQVGVKLPEGAVPEVELDATSPRAGLKVHLPTVQLPTIKVPQVDLKGPQGHAKVPKVELKGPKGELSGPKSEVSLPSVEVDVQAPGAKLEGEVTAKDSKFKMPKFKMPSFGVSSHGKSIEASLEVSAPKVEADVSLPAIPGDLKSPEVSIQLPSTDVDLQAGQVGVKLPEGALPEGELHTSGPGDSLKVHLPTVEMPTFRVPKVDLKGPQVDTDLPKVELKGPKGELRGPEAEVSPPSAEVDVQAPCAKLESEVATKDSKFKMPKFKMPSFGVSSHGKSIEASLEVSAPKVEADVSLPAIQGDLKSPEVSIQLPSTDVDLQAGQVGEKLSEGALPEAELHTTAVGGSPKVHLPKVQLPSIKVPKVDLKGPKGELSGPKPEVSLPSMEVDVQVPGAKLEGEVTAKDSKFKMPKFRMPSFGLSGPTKSIEASMDVSTPKVESDVSLPAIQGDLKSPEVSIQLPSTDMNLQAGQVGVKLPEGALPKGQLQPSGPGDTLKVQLPTVEMPSIKVPKVELKGPKGDLRGPEAEVSLPSVEVDVQAPDAKLESEVATKDSKFKMPKFKMPSFGVSGPGKSTEASVDVSAPEVEGGVSLSAIQGDLKSPEVSIQLPSTDVDLQAGQVGVKLPEGAVPEVELDATSPRAGLKVHLPTVQLPTIKVPQVDLKGPQGHAKVPKVELKGPKGELSGPESEVSLPSVEVDVQAPGAKLEGEVTAKDSKFKMPKFKMPSFGVSSHGKSIEASLEVSAPKVEADVSLPAIPGDLKSPEVSIQLPSTDVDLQAGQVGVKLPEGALPEGELHTSGPGDSLKVHLPTVEMPTFRVPKVDLKGPQVDTDLPKVELKGPKGELRGPEAEVSPPSAEVDVQAPCAKLESEVATKDSKFKMPKFKMPSFGVSSHGKSIEASLEVSAPKVEADVSLPAIQGDLKSPEVSIQLPSTDVDLQAGQVGEKLSEGALPEAELHTTAVGGSPKVHLPKVQLPSIKVPKVDLKGPKGELSGPKPEVSLPSMEVDVQVPGAKLEGEVTAKDSKFKMPKFRMPSFGLSGPTKSIEASMDVSTPKVESDVSLPAIQGDLKSPEVSIQLPSTDMNLQAGQVGVKLPEGALPKGQLQPSGPGDTLKVQLPTVEMPSIKVPKVELKGPKGDLRGPEAEVSLPSVEVDVQAPDAKLESEVATKDSKFKMPKFKMPSFGVSGPGKSTEASVDVSAPEVEGGVSLSAIQGDLKSPEVSIQLPSTDVDLQAGQVGVKLPEGAVPEVELDATSPRAGLKVHLPTVQLPTIKVPQVDLKGPQGHAKVPKVELKGPKGELSGPESEVSLPSVEVDVQAPGAKLEGEVTAKDSKFKMPKFKMPSFGVSSHGKSIEASLEVSAPKVEADVSLPAIPGDLKSPEVSIQLPSTDVDLQAGQVGVKLPEGALPEGELHTSGPGDSLKVHLPTVEMPTFRVPKVDLKGPQVDTDLPKVELKGPKGELRGPEAEVSPPSAEVDVQAPCAKLESEVATKDSKFKMPKFKMPSFGVSSHGKSIEASLEVSAPKVEADVSLPAIQGDLKSPEVSIQLPSTDVDLQAGQVGEKLSEGALPEAELHTTAVGGSPKVHLPKVQLPSIKVPKVDLKGPKGELSGPKPEVSLPSMEVDVQVPGAKLEGEVTAKDSKFKMPKFRMPSFGLSGPTKSIEASMDVSTPKVESDVSLPAIQGDLKSPEVSIQLPSTDMNLQAGQVGVKLPEGALPKGQLQPSGPGDTLKVQLPTVEMPSIKVPKVELKGPKGDLRGPEAEVSLPSVEVDVQAPDAKLESEVATKDSKFKMPKFKMPSFGVSGPGKSTEASVDVSAPEVEGGVSLSAIQGDLKSPEVSIQLPSTDVDLQAGQVGVKLPEGAVPEVELDATSPRAGLKVHLPTVQLPTIKVPQVDLKGPQGHAKVPKVELKGPKGELSGPESEVSLPSVEVDVQAPGAKLEGEVTAKDSKFKMPKFKMPSFGVSSHGKSIEASLEVSAPKVEADVSLPAIPGDLKSPEVSIQLPSTDVDLQAGQVGVKLPEGALPEGELHTSGPGDSLKVHLPTVEMPTFRVPKVDLKGPQVDTDLPKVELKGPKGELRGPEAEVSPPSAEVDVQAPCAKLESEVATKDSKFKMPKFKMPSFGVSSHGKSIEASLEVSAPKVEADVSLPAIQGDLKSPEVSIQLPSTDVDLQAGQVGEKLSEGALPEAELHTTAVGGSPKVHLPKVQLPSIKVPKVDLKGPKGELSGPKPEVSLPSMEVDVQVPGAKLEGEVTAKDSKFKMPKFRMPSFGLSGPTKSIEASMDVSTPKVESDVSLPAIQGDLKSPEVSIQLPSTDMNLQAGQVGVKLPEGALPKGQLQPSGPGDTLKVQLPTVEMPSIKVPKVELKGPKGDLRGPEAEVSLPSVEVDVQAPDAKLESEVATKDSKFKMPKFKMPSFGVSGPGKSTEASVDVSAPEVEGGVSLSAIQGDLKSPEVSIQLPSTDVDLQAGQVGVKLPEGAVPEVELDATSPRAGLKVHLPTVQLPTIKVPQVDLKGPQGHAKVPKVELKGPKGELSGPKSKVSLPSVEVDVQAPGAKLEGEVTAKDSKFKMPKFKMPSFGVSSHGKSIEASLEVSAPKVEADVSLPAIPGDLKSPEVSIQLPSTDVDLQAGQVGVKLPEGALPEGELHTSGPGDSLKVHLPTVEMPTFRVPKVDLKGPQVDTDLPKVELKGPKGELRGPEAEVSPPSAEVDVQAPCAKLESEVATKDSKFKMPKFKMPSFGVSSHGKSIEASLEVSAPKVEADVSLPAIQGDLKSPEVSIQLPSTDMDLQAGNVGVKLVEGVLPKGAFSTSGPSDSLKVNLPTVEMPSIKVPKVDLNSPLVDAKAPKVELKGPKGELSGPEAEVSLPSVEVDVQAPCAKLESEVATKDSKFKIPKFKMPSFGVSSHGKSIEASLEVSAPKVEADVSLPAIQGDLKSPEVSIQLPSTDVDLQAGQLGVKLPEGAVLAVELDTTSPRAGLKVHLPTVQLPTIKVPKVELKEPKGELSGPKSEVSLPSMDVDVQAPGAMLEGEVTAKDSKFKMPKLNMPSFDVSSHGKSIEASLDVSAPKVEADVSLPTIQGELKSPEVSIQLPSTDVDLQAGQVGVMLPDSALPDVEPGAEIPGAGLKVHLPTVQMPTFELPKVDLKLPQVDSKQPKVYLKRPKGELRGPEPEVSLPSVEVDVPAPSASMKVEVATKYSNVNLPSVQLPEVHFSTFNVAIPSTEFLSDFKVTDMCHEFVPGDTDTLHGQYGSECGGDPAVSNVFEEDGEENKFKKPPVHVSQVQFEDRKVAEDISQVEESPSPCGLGDAPSPACDLALTQSPELDVLGSASAVQAQKQVLSVFPSSSTSSPDLTHAWAGSSVLPSGDGVILTKFQVPVLSPVFAPEAPQDSASFLGSLCAAGLQAEQIAPASLPGLNSHTEGPLAPVDRTAVMFPRFHKPRFVVSVPLTVTPEGEEQGSLLPPSQEWGQDSSAHEAKMSLLPGSQLPPMDVLVSQGMEEPLSLLAGGAATEGAKQEGKGSPFKTPHFSQPPKKEARPAGDTVCRLEDSTGSLAVDLHREDSHPGAQDSRMEAHMILPLGKEGDLGRTRKAGFALPRLVLPKLKVSKGLAGLRPQGDGDTVLSSSGAASDCEATERGSSKSDVGSLGPPEGPQGAGDVALWLPQAPIPSVGFAKPELRSSLAKEGASQCEVDPRCDPVVGGGSKEPELEDPSASQPYGEGTTSTIEDPLKPSLGHTDRVHSLDSPEEVPTVGGRVADSHERWFKKPRLRVAGFRGLSSKEKGGAQEHMLAASVLASPVPGSEVETSTSLQPPDTEVVRTAPKSASYAGPLKHDLNCMGSKPHSPTVGVSRGDLPTSKVQICPAEGSLPFQMPSGRPLEPQAPAAERCDLTKAEERRDPRPSQPEGPVTLRVSSTDVPSQVSVVDTRQLWEDSVLTITFPKLKVPRFSFPATGSEADVFFPVVRDVRGAEAAAYPGPGLWGASLLRAGTEEPKEQLAGPSHPSEASLVSRARVHIQQAQGESQDVAVCSQVTQECVELVVPEAFSTQIVRESEIPASTVQTPSYGFSLLKLKTPGPPAQAPDSRARVGSAAPGADCLSGDDAPDATEPFEVLSASTSLPRAQTLVSDVRARLPPEDSGSDDEEPAEILEFPPEDSREVTALPAGEDRVPKGKLEGKKPSVLLWSWLPNIGFSSSVDETSAYPRDDIPRSVPVQTQPGPRQGSESPKRQERTGWFRFPKLGFSSTPAKNTETTEEEAALAEQEFQEESVTFFDARESLSLEEKEDSELAARALGATDAVVSSARMESILRKPDPICAREESAPRPTSK